MVEKEDMDRQSVQKEEDEVTFEQIDNAHREDKQYVSH